MNINDLTIGQAKELVEMFGKVSNGGSDLYSRYVGKYVIVRSRNEGVNAGVVVACDETGIILSNARRLWYHKPADTNQAWYEGVANSGLGEDSKISPPVSEKLIVENYSITIVTNKGRLSIEGK